MSANAGTPIAKNVSACDVLIISSVSKDPQPNKEFTICLEAIKSANVAGIESYKDISTDLF